MVSGVAAGGYTAGTTIATPIVIRITDASGLPVPDIQLSFNTTAGGWLSPDPVITDGEGIARVFWNLGREVGRNSLQISVASTPSIQVEITTTTIPGAVAILLMGPSAATIAQGSTLQLVASAADANFNIVPGSAISWVSSNETAVSVSLSGLLRASMTGNAIITAKSHGFSDSTFVTVPAPPNGAGLPAFTMALSAQRDLEITLVRSDGTVESRISCGSQCLTLGGPNWSRDGRKLALTGRRNTSSVLFVVNRDGTDLHEVASVPILLTSTGKSTLAVWPRFSEDWSADGRLVYVRVTRDGSSIETVAADGTDRRTVIAATDPIHATGGPGLPRWGLGDSMISALIADQIYTMNPDGSNPRALASVAGSIVHELTWSPDGEIIAFHRSTIGSDQHAIAILDPISGSLRQIAAPGLRSFCWAPNSSGFSMVSNEPGWDWFSIQTVSLDGSGLRKEVLAVMTGLNWFVGGAFSLDARFLIYLDDRSFTEGSGAQLYAQSIDEKTNTRISDVRDVSFFSIAETGGCSRDFPG